MGRSLEQKAATSGFGTFETWRLHRAMSAFEGNPENICSRRAFPSLTQSRHCGGAALFNFSRHGPAVEYKKARAINPITRPKVGCVIIADRIFSLTEVFLQIK
jgi:hypothetical protein